jgi:hypothetical protein
VFVVVLHFGVAPLQFASLRHWTHWLVASLHTGVSPEQFASLEQPAVQRLVDVLQMPLMPVPHSALVRHWTHWFVVVLQTGSPGVHAVTLPLLHSTHAPVAMHAGFSVVGHAKPLALPLSVVHATHVPAAVLQIGFVPTHAPVLPAVHSTHVFVVRLHTLVAPWHRFVLPALHWTHAPVVRLHAGEVVVGHAADAAVPLSPLQATQVPPAPQTGLRPPQFALVLHSTHLFAFVSQNGLLVPVHCASLVHSTQEPLALHTGVGAAQSPLSSQVEVQVLFVRLQNGVGFEQFAFDVHCTQRLVVVLQTIPSDVQTAVAVALHCTQLPPTQAGSALVEQGDDVAWPKLPLQATHWLPVQTGVLDVEPHWVELLHWTHEVPPVMQKGVGAAQAPLPLLMPAFGFAVSQTEHAPVPRHSGAVDGHANCVALPKSPLQPTHLFAAMSHEPLLPVHAVVLPSLHSRHAPATHAGNCAVGHAAEVPERWSPLHCTHSLLTHTGRPPYGHGEFTLHE